MRIKDSNQKNMDGKNPPEQFDWVGHWSRLFDLKECWWNIPIPTRPAKSNFLLHCGVIPVWESGDADVDGAAAGLLSAGDPEGVSVDAVDKVLCAFFR